MATEGTSDIVLEDVLPKPMDTIQEMNVFCTKLEELTFSKAVVRFFSFSFQFHLEQLVLNLVLLTYDCINIMSVFGFIQIC